ncbi:MAG TPA: LuxR C-terminal-related transcriptional regulator [Cytophagaceae bacterium]|jgi:DNA-binding NarL/FixJ family response regulator|nr:LuxR C-terminal-related transcriptional regulator [Cytophagaceae bacterium]
MRPTRELHSVYSPRELRRLLESGSFVSEHKLKRLFEEENFRLLHHRRFQSLTIREIEVLRLIALGETNQQISEKLFVSADTVRTHRNRIWQKLEIKNLVGAIRFASAFDLI